MKINKLNESMIPSQEILDDCLDDYLHNAFGYNGVEDYVATQYPNHPSEWQARICDYLKQNKHESLNLNEEVEHPYMFQYSCNNSTFGYDFQRYAQELGARRMYDHTQKGGGLHFYTVPSEDVYNKLKEVAKKKFTVDMYQLRPFDKDRYANAKVQEAMIIGYDEGSIKEQIRILEKNIEDYKQLIIDEPEDKDYWEDQIKKCEEEISDLQSYKPLDEAADIGEEDFIEVEDPSVVDKLGFAGAVEMRGNKIYADANTLKQLKKEMDNLTEAKVFGAKSNKLNEAWDEEDSEDEGKMVGIAFDVNAPSDMKESEIETIIRKAIDATDLYIPGYMEIHTLNESLQEKLTGYKITVKKDGKTFDDYMCAYEEEGAIRQMKNKYGDNIEIIKVDDSRVIREALTESDNKELKAFLTSLIRDNIFENLPEADRKYAENQVRKFLTKLDNSDLNEAGNFLPIEELNSDGTSKQYDVKFMDLEKVPNILNWDVADKLNAYFRKHNLWVNELYYNESRDRIEYDIEWGDWRHEHLRSKWLLEELFKELGITAKIDSHTTEEDGSDTYSAHYNVYATK